MFIFYGTIIDSLSAITFMRQPFTEKSTSRFPDNNYIIILTQKLCFAIIAAMNVIINLKERKFQIGVTLKQINNWILKIA